jgi:hypothetical protein
MAARLTLIDTTMKSFLITYFILSVIGNAHGNSTDDLKNKIDQVLSPIEEMLKEDPTGETIQASFTKSRITNSIISNFYEVAGPIDEFSQARGERAKQVEQWLLPHEDALITFLNAGEVGDPPHPSANMSLLNFAAPTEKLCAALLAVGRNTKGKAQYCGEAYDIIFKLEMETPEIMQEVIEKIAWRDNDPRYQSSEQTRLGTILLSHATVWGRKELVEMYRKFLSVPYRKEYYSSQVDKMRISSNYGIAFTGLKAFGKLDESLVVLMKDRLAEIALSGTGDDQNTIAIADDSIGIAEGKIRPKPLNNFKGQFLGISKQTNAAWLAANPAKPPTEKERPDRRLSESPVNGTRTTNKTASDSSTIGTVAEGDGKRWGLWLAGICGMAIAAILIWRWKSKATP